MSIAGIELFSFSSVAVAAPWLFWLWLSVLSSGGLPVWLWCFLAHCGSDMLIGLPQVAKARPPPTADCGAETGKCGLGLRPLVFQSLPVVPGLWQEGLSHHSVDVDCRHRGRPCEEKTRLSF